MKSLIFILPRAEEQSVLLMLRSVLITFVLLTSGATAQAIEEKTNVVFIFIDDMGYGDLSSYGNSDIETPNIDALAEQGTRFTQFYVGSPICSPSRVAVTTGRFPSRSGIHSYLSGREDNERRGMPNYLDPSSPSVARAFKNAGYATAHFGKWHMGGGRDVGDAPLPQEYGFDESLVSFEGLGDRIVERRPLGEQSAQLGRGEVRFVEKHEKTGIYVDRTIDFIRRHAADPFYVHLWLNDVHDPFFPTEAQIEKFERFSENPELQKYYAVIDAMDREIGRLIETLDRLQLNEQTLVVVSSDNGPTAWPRYEKQGLGAPGSTAGMRGRKWSLYEGGIRMPLIVRQPGRVPAGRTDDETIIGAVDLLPTFCSWAQVPVPGGRLDGVDASAAFEGRSLPPRPPLFWDYGRIDGMLKPAKEEDRSPPLAMRDGQWKLLTDIRGEHLELYDLSKSAIEDENVADRQAEVAQRMSTEVRYWATTLPGYPVPDSVKKEFYEDPPPATADHLPRRYAVDAYPWEDHIRQLERQDEQHRDPKHPILFVGSSSIRLWDYMQVDMAPYPTIGRGYGGAKYSDLAFYIERLIAAHEFDALVMFCANDVSGREDDKSPEEVAGLLKNILATVRAQNATAPIFVIEITPTRSRWDVWPASDAVNDALQAVCEASENVHFIETAGEYLTDDGQPREELFRQDQLHLNRDGYRLWARIIKSGLNGVFGTLP